MNETEAPEEFKKLIGTKQKLGGGLFSGKKELPFEEYDVLDWRFGTGQIWDTAKMIPLHPTVQLLVKKEGMRASRWTQGFPCRSIKLEKEEL